jgi:spermidine synthase
MRKDFIIGLSVFIAGLCSIVYELLISTTTSYFLGDSIKQFSLTIGIYLFSMGLGAYLTRFFGEKSLKYFIEVEYLLGVIGGLSVPILYILFVHVSHQMLQIQALGIVFIIGILTGMEVPLLIMAFYRGNVKNSLSSVLSLDYIGGLAATLIFPFLLLPFVGLLYSSLIFGLVNIFMGIFVAKFYLGDNRRALLGLPFMLLLIVCILKVNTFKGYWENEIFKDPIVFNETSNYQWIVLTEMKGNVKLYLNRVIQFSSKDEYRYHESLVHPVVNAFRNEPKKVLVLGGGENLASRELLKYDFIKEIHVVDIDKMIFELAKSNQRIKKLNNNSANDDRVRLIQEDAFVYLKECQIKYDIIIADLPDPSNEALARLYSKEFFYFAKRCLKQDGIFITQAGEVFLARKTFTCIENTLKAVFKHTAKHHTQVPSFGDWGFIMASNEPIQVQTKFELSNLKYYSYKQYTVDNYFSKDSFANHLSVNTLDNPILLNYYIDEWNYWTGGNERPQ